MAAPDVFEEMMHFRKGRDDAFLQGRFGRGFGMLLWYRFVHPIDYSFGQQIFLKCRVLCPALCCMLRGHEIDPCPQEACGSELFSVDAALASERNTLHLSVPLHSSRCFSTPLGCVSHQVMPS